MNCRELKTINVLTFSLFLLKRNNLQKKMKHIIQESLFFSHVSDQLNQCFVIFRIFLRLAILFLNWTISNRTTKQLCLAWISHDTVIFTRRVVRILLFFSWIYKKSIMPVFNDKRSLILFINLQLRCRILINFGTQIKEWEKALISHFFHTLYCTPCRQSGVVKLPQVPKSRKSISEHLISITIYILKKKKKAIQATPDN